MTWLEIKDAVDRLGIKENDEILEIRCEQGNCNHTLHQVRIGNFIVLAEDLSEAARKEAAGCCA